MRRDDVASLVEFRLGLGGDSVTDRWMDDGRMEGRMHGKIMLFSHTFTIRKSDIARFVEFHPVV